MYNRTCSKACSSTSGNKNTFTVKEFAPIDHAQLINYLKISELQLGLLINFNVLKLKNGIKRIVNNYTE
jgi:hypothetical protein